jgi:hypothetical protein
MSDELRRLEQGEEVYAYLKRRGSDDHRGRLHGGRLHCERRRLHGRRQDAQRRHVDDAGLHLQRRGLHCRRLNHDLTRNHLRTLSSGSKDQIPVIK